VAKLREGKVAVWLIGMMAPRNLGPEYASAFDGLYRRLADKYQVPLYPFILDGVAQEATLNQADGIHPNPEGVEVVVKHMVPFVTRNLDEYAAAVHRPSRP
jgi:acyl-CoA thioesterase I